MKFFHTPTLAVCKKKKKKTRNRIGRRVMESEFANYIAFHYILYNLAINSLCVKWGKLYKRQSTNYASEKL